MEKLEEKETVIEQEKDILAKSKDKDYQILGAAFIHSITGSDHISEKRADFEASDLPKDFNLDLEESEVQNFVLKLKPITLIDIDSLEFYGITLRNKHFILDLSFPDKVRDLSFCNKNEGGLDISYYFKQIAKISSRVLKVSFYKFHIKESQFKRLLASFKHVKSFNLDSCKFRIQTVTDFSYALKRTQIENISLNSSGLGVFNDWKNKPEEFQNLVVSFSTSPDLKLSLTTLCIVFCKLNSSEVLQLLKKNGFDNCKIISKPPMVYLT
ncbi:unnamed protein product [Moneuplotes crassus]|uniref:Uncharacterized protein n=1 Tax=Euplotes crassus TaxID=5936 RepID=A0AAD1XGA3_EUPCR|nr:unnamed protein product [Moneuplotes crassus]